MICSTRYGALDEGHRSFVHRAEADWFLGACAGSKAHWSCHINKKPGRLRPCCGVSLSPVTMRWVSLTMKERFIVRSKLLCVYSGSIYVRLTSFPLPRAVRPHRQHRPEVASRAAALRVRGVRSPPVRGRAQPWVQQARRLPETGTTADGAPARGCRPLFRAPVTRSVPRNHLDCPPDALTALRC